MHGVTACSYGQVLGRCVGDFARDGNRAASGQRSVGAKLEFAAIALGAGSVDDAAIDAGGATNVAKSGCIDRATQRCCACTAKQQYAEGGRTCTQRAAQVSCGSSGIDFEIAGDPVDPGDIAGDSNTCIGCR